MIKLEYIEFPYQCDECGREFQLRIDYCELINPPYFCDECEKAFERLELNKCQLTNNNEG